MLTRTDTPDFMASYELTWLKADDSEVRLVARVGVPYRVGDREWACAAELEGYDGGAFDIRGGSSMQALCLAIGFVRTRLGHLVAKDGRLRDVEGGDDWGLDEIDMVFGRRSAAAPAAS
jgi:hypothetical protein